MVNFNAISNIWYLNFVSNISMTHSVIIIVICKNISCLVIFSVILFKNSALVCELAGIFLFDKISVKYDKNSIGLHGDNGLSVFKDKAGTQL